MAQRDFDCVVGGGGPAGSTAGAYLARAGLRTLIVEKERFPRFHIGESLLPAGNDILREIGVWDAVEAAGFMPKHGAEFHVGERLDVGKRVRFVDGLIPGNPYTYQVERSRFDELLLRHAESLGCVVRERTRLTAADPHSDGSGGWEVTISTAGGAGPETVRTGWIIDGSGRDNGFTHALKSDRVDPGGNLPKRAAIYAHFRGVRRATGPEGGNIVIVRHADGWFWLIPIDAERTSVGLVTTLATVRAANGRVGELLQETVARLPKLTDLMAGAEPVTGFEVTADYTYRARRFASGRLLLVGDAAGFFDPIFSSGVFLGLRSARLAAAEVIRAERGGGRPLSPWRQRRYTRQLAGAAAVFQKLILAFYDNDAYSVFVDHHPPIGLGRAVNSIVAGHTRLPWRVWWRFQVFLLVCRLQRRWSLVPPIPLTRTAPTLEPAGCV